MTFNIMFIYARVMLWLMVAKQCIFINCLLNII